MQLESLSEKSELDLLGAEKKVITDNIQVIESELRNISDEINSRRAIKEKLTWEINNVKYFRHYPLFLFACNNEISSLDQCMKSPYSKSKVQRKSFQIKHRLEGNLRTC